MGSKANIYIDQGTDFRITLELFDGDNDDLTIQTFSFFADLRKMYSSKRAAEFVVEKNENDITLVLEADVTANLRPGKYEYDVLMRKSSGEMSKIVEGLAIVIPTITEV
jgi:hypothetical protein|tara:strand:+ start:508 stop:834 length:327 start_codon:yes stop_codon:yes gene_type:complete